MSAVAAALVSWMSVLTVALFSLCATGEVAWAIGPAIDDAVVSMEGGGFEVATVEDVAAVEAVGAVDGGDGPDCSDDAGVAIFFSATGDVDGVVSFGFPDGSFAFFFLSKLPRVGIGLFGGREFDIQCAGETEMGLFTVMRQWTDVATINTDCASRDPVIGDSDY